MVAPEGAIDDALGSGKVQRRLKELSTRLLKPCNVAPLGPWVVIALDDPLRLKVKEGV